MQYSGSNIRNKLDWIAVLWIILSTGSLYFCIFNMQLTMFILLGIAVCYVLLNVKIKKRQFNVCMSFLAFIAINMILNIQYLSLGNDVIIMLIRLLSLTVICANMTVNKFMSIYIRILVGLAVLSLVCFSLTMLGTSLPGQTSIWFKDKYYIYTMYHTVGRWTVFNRNAGIFWEAPAFAIFINIGLLFLMLGDVDIEPKRRIWYFIILSVTMFTTMSTTAYVQYILVILAVVFKNSKKERKKDSRERKYRWLIVVGVILMAGVLVYIENKYQIIQYKLFQQQGSYTERSNDMMGALRLVVQRPITGFGLFNNYTREALNGLKVTDNSNSFFTMFLYLGIPMALVYFGYFFYRIKKMFSKNWICSLCIIGAFIVMINSEQIALMTLFLVFLFPFSNSDEYRIESEGI